MPRPGTRSRRRCPARTHARAVPAPPAAGRLAIVNLQRTQHDRKAERSGGVALHARVDVAMEVLARRLGLVVPPYVRTDRVLLCLSRAGAAGTKRRAEPTNAAPDAAELATPGSQPPRLVVSVRSVHGEACRLPAVDKVCFGVEVRWVLGLFCVVAGKLVWTGEGRGGEGVSGMGLPSTGPCSCRRAESFAGALVVVSRSVAPFPSLQPLLTKNDSAIEQGLESRWALEQPFQAPFDLDDLRGRKLTAHIHWKEELRGPACSEIAHALSASSTGVQPAEVAHEFQTQEIHYL